MTDDMTHDDDFDVNEFVGDPNGPAYRQPKSERAPPWAM